MAYGTRFGSTAEIADVIGATLREAGATVDVLPVGDVRGIEAYRAVVVGSAIHRGHLLPEVVAFVQSSQELLGRVPVALFCVHISSPPPPARDAYLDDVRGFVRPVAKGFFAGRFDRRGAALLIPKILAWAVPPIDRRNWREIRGWARSLAPLLAGRDQA